MLHSGFGFHTNHIWLICKFWESGNNWIWCDVLFFSIRLLWLLLYIYSSTVIPHVLADQPKVTINKTKTVVWIGFLMTKPYILYYNEKLWRIVDSWRSWLFWSGNCAVKRDQIIASLYLVDPATKKKKILRNQSLEALYLTLPITRFL